ncbi:MAG: 3'-5' exonuclease [Alphaproteobacteria bacterium]|nr:3'-5' exonuclease [Alphaproteobacteria bacterium]
MPDLFKGQHLVVLDTETTGFPAQRWARVIEVGAVLLAPDGAEVDTFEALVLPDILDERAHAAAGIHGITNETLRAEGVPQDEVCAALRETLAAWGDPYLTAFNVGFDRPMLLRMGIGRRRWARCIMQRASAVMGKAGALKPRSQGGWRWPSLARAVDFFGVEVDGPAHRALTDARMAAGVARAIREREV